MECKCKRCGYGWTSRVKKPLQCPACKSYRWMKEKQGQQSVTIKGRA